MRVFHACMCHKRVKIVCKNTNTVDLLSFESIICEKLSTTLLFDIILLTLSGGIGFFFIDSKRKRAWSNSSYVEKYLDHVINRHIRIFFLIFCAVLRSVWQLKCVQINHFQRFIVQCVRN